MNQVLDWKDYVGRPPLWGASRAVANRERRRQKGSMLIDTALALTIATMTLSGQFANTTEAVDESLAKATGQWAVEYQGGINGYYSDYGQQIMAGQSVPGVASPYAPTVPELINLGYLPSGFNSTAPNGQTFSSTVSQVCASGNCSLAGYVVSTTPYKDSSGAVRNDLAGIAMQAAGADGGMSTPGNAGKLIGTGNGWQTPMAGVPVGTFAMRVGSYAATDARLKQFYMLNGSRKLTGPMNANGNSIGNVSTLGTTGNITTSGGAFVASSGGVGVQIASAQLYGDWANIALRAPGGAYVQHPDGSWATMNAGTVNAYQDLSVAGNTWLNGTNIAGSANISGNASIQGSTSLNGYASLNSTTWLNGTTVHNGYTYMQGGVVVNTPLAMTPTAYAGWGCSGTGITTDPYGNILTCQGGVWAAPSSQPLLGGPVSSGGADSAIGVSLPSQRSVIITAQGGQSGGSVTAGILVDGAYCPTIANTSVVDQGYWSLSSTGICQITLGPGYHVFSTNVSRYGGYGYGSSIQYFAI